MSAPTPPAPSATWEPSFPRIRRLDETWFRAERALCAAMFLAMAVLVLAAVVTETFGNRRHGGDVAVLFGVALLAVRTRTVKDGERRWRWWEAVALAAAVTAALAAAVYLYTEHFPGGFIWAQKLALVMMIWVALLGASMATHERSHLALEMGEKLWPERARRHVKAVAHAVTSGFCLAGLLLSIHLVRSQAGQGLHVEANSWLPTWQAFLILPYTFAAMAVRFLAQAVTQTTGTARPEEARLPT